MSVTPTNQAKHSVALTNQSHSLVNVLAVAGQVYGMLTNTYSGGQVLSTANMVPVNQSRHTVSPVNQAKS